MRYVCFVYHDEKSLAGCSEVHAAPSGAGPLVAGAGRTAGPWLDAQQLERGHTVITLRVRDGNLSIADGPLIESHWRLDGYVLIEARDLNDAIRIAAKLPSAQRGYIEIRPVRELHADTLIGEYP